jgi:hypothetical protein
MQVTTNALGGYPKIADPPEGHPDTRRDHALLMVISLTCPEELPAALLPDRVADDFIDARMQISR